MINCSLPETCQVVEARMCYMLTVAYSLPVFLVQSTYKMKTNKFSLSVCLVQCARSVW